jgi:hypothetical protein
MIILMLLATGSLMCTAQPRPDARADTVWLLAPSAANDAVHAFDTEQSLRERYGDSAVTRQRVNLGEGETAPGLVLFANDGGRRLEIAFQDTVALTKPTRVTLRGAATRWFVYPGVTLGTHLDALERLNAGPFVLMGLGWDYAGTVMNWSNGKLATLWPRNARGEQSVVLRLEAGRPAAEAALARKVVGDREFPSSAMRKLNPQVYEMSIRPR